MTLALDCFQIAALDASIVSDEVLLVVNIGVARACNLPLPCAFEHVPSNRNTLGL